MGVELEISNQLLEDALPLGWLNRWLIRGIDATLVPDAYVDDWAGGQVKWPRRLPGS